MSSETLLRQEIRQSLGFVRSLIDHYSGLYAGENLTRDVLLICDEMTDTDEPDVRLKEARRVVEERCRQLAQATDRFAQRDPAVIAISRAQAVAAIDLFQDAAFEYRKTRTIFPSSGRLLRRKSL
ncbi:hypothetical protein [Microvirga zambiensis]|uniref:hypothetical protein n=1 Tax=Microvirga zambiensis TaxID=1402137 RepID=UPI00191E6253|nr:hypothetical protein [Microvirga zambiensis]